MRHLDSRFFPAIIPTAALVASVVFVDDRENIYGEVPAPIGGWTVESLHGLPFPDGVYCDAFLCAPLADLWLGSTEI